MIHTPKSILQRMISPSLIKRMTLGGAIALLLMILFLVPIDEPNPEWGNLWFVRPLVVVTITGALGGAFYDVMTSIPGQTPWQRIGTTLISLVAYVIALWFGSILGLDGTLWN